MQVLERNWVWENPALEQVALKLREALPHWSELSAADMAWDERCMVEAIVEVRSPAPMEATLSDADYRKSLSHLLGSSPTAREAKHTPGFGGFMTAFINKSLIEESASTTVHGSFADYFTEARERANTQAVHGLATFDKAVADKSVSKEEVKAIEEHREKQEAFKQETDATENMVADIATTVMAVIVAIALAPTGGVGSAVVIAAALKTLSKEALLGDDYDMWGPEMWHDAGMAAVDGFTGALAAPATELIMGAKLVTREAAIEALVKAADFSLKGYGKTLAEGTVRTFVEGAFMGLGHGAAETAMDPETWQKGVDEAIVKLTEGSLEAALEWAIMGAALGGPIAVGGKLITRTQVGGMVKRLAAKGISTEGMSPSQIVRTNWALELEAAGKEAEGRMLREMVEREMKGAEEEVSVEVEPKTTILGESAEPNVLESTELGRNTRNRTDGKDPAFREESELLAEGNHWEPLPDGHKLIETPEGQCYICSRRCPNIGPINARFPFLKETRLFELRLSKLGELFETGNHKAYGDYLSALGKDLLGFGAVALRLEAQNFAVQDFNLLVEMGYQSEILWRALGNFNTIHGEDDFGKLIALLKSYGPGEKPDALLWSLERLSAADLEASDFLARVANMHPLEELHPLDMDLLWQSHLNGDALLAKSDLQTGQLPDKEVFMYAGEVSTKSGETWGRPAKTLEGKLDFVIIDRGNGLEMVLGKEHSGISGNSPSVYGAGEIRFDKNGIIYEINNQSGHYRPSANNLDRSYKWFVESGYLDPGNHPVKIVYR